MSELLDFKQKDLYAAVLQGYQLLIKTLLSNLLVDLYFC